MYRTGGENVPGVFSALNGKSLIPTIDRTLTKK